MTISDTSNKKIAKNTLFLFFRSFFLLAIGLYTTRITLQVLGFDDYGIFQVVGGFVAMFAVISSTLTSASQRYITYSLGENVQNHSQRVFSTCLTLHLLFGIIVVAILELFGIWFLYNKLNIPIERLDVTFWVFQFSIISFFVNILSIPFNALIIAYERMGAFAYISVLDGVLKLILAAVLLVISFDKLFFYSFFVMSVSILLQLIYSFYCRRHFDEANKMSMSLDKELFKRMFQFAGWNFIGAGALAFRNQGIDVLLNFFWGVVVNAAKGITNQIHGVVYSFVNNFTTAINPQLTKSIAKKDYLRAHQLIFLGSKFSFFLMMLVSVPFIVSCNEITIFWLKDVPCYTNEMLMLTFILMQSEILSRLLINANLAYGDIRNFQLVGGSIKLLALPTTFLILKSGGNPLSGILVNIILDFVCVWPHLYFSNKRFHLNSYKFLVDVYLRSWITFSVVILFSFIFHHVICSNLFISVPVSFIITLCGIVTIGINHIERSKLKSQILIKIHNR